ncbi:MAG: RluA family pseudouridine synthase [Hyphomonadaceae bacterium]
MTTAPSPPASPEQPVIAQQDAAGARLDKWMSEAFPDLSRSRAKALIEEGRVSVNGAVVTDPRTKVVAGEPYVLDMPPPAPATPQPEDIPLAILHEDPHLIIVNKPAGMVVHPTPGQWTGTLVNALLHHCGDSLTGIGGVARPGIVHRLDKDTSGVMVVAKSEPAHTALVALFQAHDIERAYLAVTRGAPRPLIGRIETRIARSPHDRKKMAVVRERFVKHDPYSDDPERQDDGETEHGKIAITNYRTLETFGRLDDAAAQPAAALVECRLETGRTHQIRVHMAHIGAPVMGDPTYGKNRGVKAFGKGPAFDHAVETARAFRRQALHAHVLGFVHPITNKPLRFEAPPPEDMSTLIDALRAMS